MTTTDDGPKLSLGARRALAAVAGKFSTLTSVTELSGLLKPLEEIEPQALLADTLLNEYESIQDASVKNALLNHILGLRGKFDETSQQRVVQVIESRFPVPATKAAICDVLDLWTKITGKLEEKGKARIAAFLLDKASTLDLSEIATLAADNNYETQQWLSSTSPEGFKRFVQKIFSLWEENLDLGLEVIRTLANDSDRKALVSTEFREFWAGLTFARGLPVASKLSKVDVLRLLDTTLEEITTELKTSDFEHFCLRWLMIQGTSNLQSPVEEWIKIQTQYSTPKFQLDLLKFEIVHIGPSIVVRDAKPEQGEVFLETMFSEAHPKYRKDPSDLRNLRGLVDRFAQKKEFEPHVPRLLEIWESRSPGFKALWTEGLPADRLAEMRALWTEIEGDIRSITKRITETKENAEAKQKSRSTLRERSEKRAAEDTQKKSEEEAKAQRAKEFQSEHAKLTQSYTQAITRLQQEGPVLISQGVQKLSMSNPAGVPGFIQNVTAIMQEANQALVAKFKVMTEELKAKL